MKFKVKGIVIVKETKAPVPGVVVSLFDTNPQQANIPLSMANISIDSPPSDFWAGLKQTLGSTLTDRNGQFEISYNTEDFAAGDKEGLPDLVFMVLAPAKSQSPDTPVSEPQSKRLLHITTMPRTDAAREKTFSIPLLQSQIDKFDLSVPRAGVVIEHFDPVEMEVATYAKKDKIRNYTFGTSSAVGILAGCIFGISMSKGLYETVLFILFFGCFLGSLFGAISTIIVVKLYTLLLYILSPAYRSRRQYLSAKSKAGSRAE